MKKYSIVLLLFFLLIPACWASGFSEPIAVLPTVTSPISTATLPPPTYTPIPPTATEATQTATSLPTDTPRKTPAQAPFEEVKDIDFWKGQKLDLYLPTRADGPYPVVLLLHEGNGRKEQLITWGQRFAELGYSAVAGNYRGWPNYQYPQDVSDAFCMLGWIHANAHDYNLDTGQVYVLGHSAGGTLAAMIGVVNDPGLVKSSPYQRERSKL
jgi:acetyl esterase/lipase